MCLFEKFHKALEVNYLTLALIVTAIIFVFNEFTGYNSYTNWIDTKPEYLVVFVCVILGLCLLRKVPALKSLFSKAENPNNVPYHIVESQYGDQALLAGYNEDVVPAN